MTTNYTSTDNPYKEIILCPRVSIRTFNISDREEFVWHRDREDRIIESNSDWFIQLDNKLPVSIKKPVVIPTGIYHRVIPGKDETADIKVIKF